MGKLAWLCWVVLGVVANVPIGHAADRGARPTVEVRLGHGLRDSAAIAELSRLADAYGAGHAGTRVLVGEIGSPGFERSNIHLALLEDDDDLSRAVGGRPVRPLAAVAARNGVRIDATRLNAALREAASDEAGALRALPLAHFLPALYLNADAFRAASVALPNAPLTWSSLQAIAGSLHDGGVHCPYATSWPVWVHLENVSARHGERFLIGSGRAMRLSFNNLVLVKHIALMSSWRQSRYLHLFGDAAEADEAFRAGQCAMLTSGSHVATRLKRTAGFEVRVAELPYYDDVPGAAGGRLVPSGGSLWVLAGLARDVERSAVQFVAYLAGVEAQRTWVEASGYLPMLREVGVVGSLPPEMRAATAVGASGRRQLPAARERLGPSYEQVMEIIRDEMNAVWATGKAPKEALDDAVRRGNSILDRGAGPARP